MNVRNLALIGALLVTSSAYGVCNLDHCCDYGQGITKKAKATGGFIEKHEQLYFETLRHVDALMDRFSGYYHLENPYTPSRKIVIKKQLSSADRGMIVSAAKDLDSVVELYATCSPGDHDYLDVKEKYLPLAREVRHRLHTFIMQPLNVSKLDVYDHARRIGMPVAGAALGVATYKLLKKYGMLPAFARFDDETVYAAAVVGAGLVIANNYRDELSASQQIELLSSLPENGIAPGTDFGALIHAVDTSEQAEVS